METSAVRNWTRVIKWVAVPLLIGAVGFFVIGPRIGKPGSTVRSSAPPTRTAPPSEPVEMEFPVEDGPAPTRIEVSTQPPDPDEVDPEEHIPGPDDPVPPPFMSMDGDEASIGGIGKKPPAGDEGSIGGIGTDPPDDSGDDDGDAL